jgi:hypothetical protein
MTVGHDAAEQPAPMLIQVNATLQRLGSLFAKEGICEVVPRQVVGQCIDERCFAIRKSRGTDAR